MCGIIAYLTTIKDYQILNSIIQSLKTLQNRGYDSSGIGIYHDKELLLKKIIGKNLDALLEFDINPQLPSLFQSLELIDQLTASER